MEHQSTMHHNFFINFILVSLSTGSGFISYHFQEQLKALSVLLTPVVQLCSIASFVCFLIINYKSILKFFGVKFKK